jgi:hypothetical protein
MSSSGIAVAGRWMWVIGVPKEVVDAYLEEDGESLRGPIYTP